MVELDLSVEQFPLTGYAVVMAFAALLVCSLWSIAEFIASYRRHSKGKGVSCFPALPALAPLLAPLMYVRSFGGGQIVWPSLADSALACLVMLISVAVSLAIGTFLPVLFASKAAASQAFVRRLWLLGYWAIITVIVGISFLWILSLPYSLPTIPK